MATADFMTICSGTGGQTDTDTRFSLITGSANLLRNPYNTSNCPMNKQDCDAKGGGYTFDGTGYSWGWGKCYLPCPDAYTVSALNPRECEPRPLLTKVSIYYEILNTAVNDCARLIPAYRDAVAEANNDPTQVGFPAGSGCVNPFDPPPAPAPTLPEEYAPPEGGALPNPAGSNENTTSDGVFDPTPSNGDPTKPEDAPPQTDPNGSSGQAGQQNGGIDGASGEPFIPTMPDGTTQVPYIPPPPPAYQEIDESDPSGMSKTLPRDRLLITADEIAQLPKVNDFGVMTEGDLALRLQVHPTFLDTNPSYLKEFQTYVPSFAWECSITQAEFDLLPEDWKCRLCSSYEGTIYGMPSNIQILRAYAPTITMTRNAPSTMPTFVGCPQEVKKVACESKTGWGGGACSYSGGCNGTCECPSPPDTGSSGGVLGEMDTTTMLLLGGGFVAVSIFLLR